MKPQQTRGLWAEAVLFARAQAAGEAEHVAAAEAAPTDGRRRLGLGAGAIWGGALVLAALVFAVAVAVADPLNGEPGVPAANAGDSPAAAMSGASLGADAEPSEDGDADGEVPADEPSADEPSTAKPYSELTPVDDPDNTVNTHQLPDSSFLYDTSLDDLAGADSYYEDQTVQIVGEVIGDLIKEGFDDSHVWVTLASTSGSGKTVMVYMTTGQASIIDTLGGYGRKGTILQVRGKFHLACGEHQGLSDIHVDNVNVVESGSRTPDVFDWHDFIPGIIGLVLAGALILVFHMLRQRLR